MPDSDFNGFARSDGQWVNPLERELAPDKDLVMEQILDNIHNTPIGQVLKKIASLPEIRREKVVEPAAGDHGRSIRSGGTTGYCARSCA